MNAGFLIGFPAPAQPGHRFGRQGVASDPDDAYVVHPEDVLAAGCRVTVDRELRWESASGFVRAVGLLILESKTAPGSTADLDRALWSLGHRPVRLSKYGTGLSILNPDLPGNKWHRLAEPLRAAVNNY